MNICILLCFPCTDEGKFGYSISGVDIVIHSLLDRGKQVSFGGGDIGNGFEISRHVSTDGGAC